MCFRQRLEIEKKDIDQRIKEYQASIGTDGYWALSMFERMLMNRQLDAMREYSRLLGERIVEQKVSA